MSNLNPHPTQSPSGRMLGPTSQGPQPVILQRKAVESTTDALYEITDDDTYQRIASAVVGSQDALVTFTGVAAGTFLQADFRLAAQSDGANNEPGVELRADFGDGAGFVPLPTTRQVRDQQLQVTQGMQWELQSQQVVPAGTNGTVQLEARWTVGDVGEGADLRTEYAPDSTDQDAQPGGWYLEGLIVQPTP